MRKRLLLLFWCLLLVVSCYEATPTGRGTAGVRSKATTSQTINPDSLYSASYALVIGASDYTDGWPKLPEVKTDIAEVEAVLQKLGFEVTTVLDPDKTALAKAFDDFIDRHGRVLNNRLLFYFAGHGYTAKKSYGEDMGYIVPVDAPNPLQDLDGFLKFGLDMQMIEVYAKRIEAKHALFVFDSCFSGSLFALSRAVPASITYKTAKPVRQFITSGSADEEVPDRSTFRGQFVAALDGEADKDGDGYVTGSELGMFLQNSVTNYSYGAQHPQYGTIRNPNLDKGDFVFQVGAVVTTPQEPSSGYQSILPPNNSNFSLAKLKEEESWKEWQGNMQNHFNETAAFRGSATTRRKAWQLFLNDHKEDNPYSQDDERLRTTAQQQQAAIRDESVVETDTSPVVEKPTPEPETQSLLGSYTARLSDRDHFTQSDIVNGSAGGSTSAGADSNLIRCSETLGTLAVDDGREANWYSEFGRTTQVTTIEPLLRLAVQQSNCFLITSVGNQRSDSRTSRITKIQRNSGKYRANSKQKKVQRVVADYYLEPQIIINDSSVVSVGAIAGGLEAKASVVTLSLFDIRSAVQIVAAEGSSTATNYGAAFGSLGIDAGGVLAGFSQTPEGKATVAAFIDAWNKMVIALRNYKAQEVEGGF